MSKLIVGDIHTKAIIILPKIDKLINEYNINEIYFLGDYVDDWGVSNAERIKDLRFLIDWDKNSKTNNTFLCGNHDLAYIVPQFSCSGHSKGAEFTLSQMLAKELNVTMSAIVDDYLLTHAGINSDWLAVLNNYVDMTGTINDTLYNINYFLNKELEEVKDLVSCVGPAYKIYNIETMKFITACSAVRGGFDKYSGPLWCDKNELIAKPAINFKQIVGHTPVETCTKISFEELTDATNLWFCDTNSLFSDSKPIGDNSMLLLDNKKCKKI